MTGARGVLAGATAAFACVSLAVAMASGQQAPAAGSGTGQIAGVVTTAESGSTRTVRRAMVRITSPELRGSREIVTDDAGRFLFVNLPAGRFTLTASKPGHVTQAYGAKSSRGPGTPIVLGDGQRVLALKVHLPRGAVISGTVRDWTGQPYWAGVTVYERSVVDGRITLRPAGFPAAEAGGEYRVYGLPAGEYYVGTGFAGPLAEGVTPTTAALVRWAEKLGLAGPGTAAAPPPAAAPVAFAPIFYPGVARFSAAESVVVGEGEERRGVDLTIRLAPALSVSGILLRPDGQRAPGVLLAVTPAGDEPSVPFSPRPRAVTDASGAFVLSNVAPGSYVVSATTAAGGPIGRDAGAVPNWFAAERIDVAGNLTGLALTLQPSVAVRGRVAIAAGASPLDMGRVRVSIASAPSHPITITRQSGAIAADGSFAVEGLPGGRYRLNVFITETGQSGRRSWTAESIVIAGRDVLDRPFDIPAGAGLEGVVITLTDRIGDLSGRLLEGESRPASGYAVVLFSVDPEHWTTSSTRAAKTTRAGSDGTYRFDGLAAGTYYVAAADEIAQTQLTDAAYLGQFIPAATRITIAPGEKKVQDFRVGGGAPAPPAPTTSVSAPACSAMLPLRSGIPRMRTGVVVNPVSGPPRGPVPPGPARIEFARRLAGRTDPSIEVVATIGQGHAADLAREWVSRGFARVVAWGGDGTINEAAGPLIGSGVTLGIVPAGSGDGLARGLGLQRPPEEALAVALSQPAAAVDVGMLGDRHFLNIGGIGFDAAVASVFNARSKRGQAGYVYDSLIGVWSYRSRAYRIEVGAERFDGPRFVVAFANCREYGNGIILVPNADPADGKLDMVMVAGGSTLRQFWRARRLSFRRLAPAEGVRRARVTSASITGDALQCHVDGQPFDTSGTLQVAIKPGAILVAGAPTGARAVTPPL